MVPSHFSRATNSLRSGSRLLNTTKSILPRGFANKAPKRNRYARFEDAPGPNFKPRKPWWDMSGWDTRQRVLAAVVAGGGVYYVTQCVSGLTALARAG